MGVSAVIARTAVNAKPEANHRRRGGIHDARGGLDVDHARLRFDVHHLRRSLHHLRRRLNDLNLRLFVTRLWRINHLSVRNGRRVLDYRRRLAVDLLAINGSLINGGRRLIHRLPGRHNCPNETPCDGANHGAFGPAVTIMTADKPARDSTHGCSGTHRRAKDLRLGRTNARQRDRDSDKKCFHFDSSDECDRSFIHSIYRSRTNNQPANSAIAAWGSHAAQIGSINPRVANVVATLLMM